MNKDAGAMPKSLFSSARISRNMYKTSLPVGTMKTTKPPYWRGMPRRKQDPTEGSSIPKNWLTTTEHTFSAV